MKEVRRRKKEERRGRQALVAGLALLARPLVVSVVGTPLVLARLLDAAEDLVSRVERARGLAVIGTREIVHKTGGEAAAPRVVEAGPRRRRYEGEEYEWPHRAAAAQCSKVSPKPGSLALRIWDYSELCLLVTLHGESMP
jgi:hypothetical protein